MNILLYDSIPESHRLSPFIDKGDISIPPGLFNPEIVIIHFNETDFKEIYQKYLDYNIPIILFSGGIINENNIFDNMRNRDNLKVYGVRELQDRLQNTINYQDIKCLLCDNRLSLTIKLLDLLWPIVNDTVLFLSMKKEKQMFFSYKVDNYSIKDVIDLICAHPLKSHISINSRDLFDLLINKPKTDIEFHNNIMIIRDKLFEWASSEDISQKGMS